MLSVYNYMLSGVLLTGVVALLFAKTSLINLLFTVQQTERGLAYGPSLLGASLSTIFLAYTDTSIAQVFFGTAAGFAALSLYGYTTKKDLSGLGTFLIMGLIGLIVAMVVNLFLQSGTMSLVISAIGVLIFAGLTAYDTQKIKSMYAYVAGTDAMGKVVIMGALNLYLDFINMFLFLLRLFGSSRD
ncbi:MAG: hypothetical protein B7Z20_12385 [Sphingobium sp. 32-64-5]|nr:MAG: hypothetical protein B7Z20_12385 [Sphingobium sp. 32-64-5]